ncbi:MAG: plastocyanin/azurin family copper-binding protein [Tepidiformaceae bacterium]
MVPGLKRLVLGGLLAAAVLLPLGGLGTRDALAEPATVMVRAGDGEPGYAVNEFLSETVVVAVGDTITWDFPWFEPHTVTFGIPTGDPTAPTHPGTDPVAYTGAEFVSSGLVFGDPAAAPSFSMRFDTVGTYPYVCIIHPFMTGTVVVTATEFDRDTQAEIDAEGEALYQSALADLKSIAAGLNAAGASVSTKPNGTKQYGLTIGPSTLNGDVMQFFPAGASIKTGDSIVWTNDGPVPHTVTFNIQSAPAEVLANPDIFAVPPFKPAAGAGFDGATFAHSGIVGDGFPDGKTFELTFSKAGTYNYICVLHADQAMVGTVTVSQAAPGAPNTGAGLVEASTSEDGRTVVLASLILGAIAVTAVAGATTYAVKR